VNPKLKSSKLRINAQTIRALSGAEAGSVAGGLSLANCNFSIRTCDKLSAANCDDSVNLCDQSAGCGLTSV
jgi:hypothetical protein